MTEWIALSGAEAGCEAGCETAPLPRGSLLIGLSRPVADPTVVMELRIEGGRAGLSVMVDPALGIGVIARAGSTMRRHWLAGPLPAGLKGGVTLNLSWDMAQGRWSLAAEGGGSGARATGTDPLPPPPGLGAALADAARTPGAFHPAVLWWGLSRGIWRNPPGAALGPDTLVATPGGYAPLGRLRSGDRVLTLDQGAQPLAALYRHAAPHRATLAPVRLRAGHFPIPRDMLAGPQTRLLFDGAAVEYLFGTEEVLAAAGDITDRLVAQRLRTGTASTLVCPVTERPALILCDGVAVLSGAVNPALPAPRPCLRPYETAALLPDRPMAAELTPGLAA